MHGLPKVLSLCLFSAVLVIVPSGELLADEEPPLPTWEVRGSVDPNLAAGSSFSNLLPESSSQDVNNDFFLSKPEMLKSPPLLLDDPGLSPHDLALFLRGGLLSTAQQQPLSSPTPSLALHELPEHVLETLKQVPRNEYLIDPQSLVTEIPALDLDRLLNFHATEARILLYVLVLDRDQTLSATSKLNQLIGQLHSNNEICLAIYPLGEPWRARFLVSQTVHHSISTVSLTDMAQDCIKESMLTSDPERQLQRFAVRLSTRLFWLEKLLPKVTTPNSKPVLHEVAQKVGSGIAIPLISLEGEIRLVGMTVFGLVVCAGLVYSLRSVLHTMALRKAKCVWILPETDIRTRLGGAFSGGAGAMASYGESKRSPVE